MRIPSIAVVACLAAAPVAAQQTPPCGASPRWIAIEVTLHQSWSVSITNQLEDEASDAPWMRGERILDRCNVVDIHATSDGAGSLIQLRRRNHGDRQVVLTTAESPKEICAALRDCAVVSPSRRGTDQ